MDADLTPERLSEFIKIADPTWVHAQLEKYESFREMNSPENHWAHRPPSMSPVIPLVYWSSRIPYRVTNESSMGYWYGEPKSILGRLTADILEFRDYWEGLPEGVGISNLQRFMLRTPGRFAGFECEVRTASTYKNSTLYRVEPKFFDPRSRPGEPDIVLRRNGKTFNVQCKVMDPSKSSAMPFELFQYLVGCVGRVMQDFMIHGFLSLRLSDILSESASKKDVDHIVSELRNGLDNGRGTVRGSFLAGEFSFTHIPSKKSMSSNIPDGLVMWTKDYLFRERRTFETQASPSRKLTTVCQVSGGKIPSFENFVFPKLEVAARDAPNDHPTAIYLHLYPPVPVHQYVYDQAVQKKVLPDLTKFFDRHRHICFISISSYAQIAVPVGGNMQKVMTPSWEVESQHWSGERPYLPNFDTGDVLRQSMKSHQEYPESQA